MTAQEKAYVLQWIAKGSDDLLVAKMIIEQDVPVLDVACFHIQQAVEKFFKAFLVAKKEEFPKTHNLDYLKVLCIRHDAGFAEFEVGDLENYAVRNRYPHDNDLPEPAEAKRLYDLGVAIRQFVQDLLN